MSSAKWMPNNLPHLPTFFHAFRYPYLPLSPWRWTLLRHDISYPRVTWWLTVDSITDVEYRMQDGREGVVREGQYDTINRLVQRFRLSYNIQDVRCRSQMIYSVARDNYVSDTNIKWCLWISLSGNKIRKLRRIT